MKLLKHMTAQIIYTTFSGNTEYLVKNLKVGLSKNFSTIELTRVELLNIASFGKFDLTIFAVPTYNVGRMPIPFDNFTEQILEDNLKLNNRYCANIVLGDSEHYDLFCGAKNYIENFTTKIGMSSVLPTTKVDGETFNKADEWVKLGEKIAESYLNILALKEIKFKNLNALFSPESIAVIGVSENPTKLGHVILKNIIDGGYTGKLYAINPKIHKDTIYSIPYLNSIKSTQNVDLAIIAIPSEFVADSLHECISTGIENFVIISSNFGESANEIAQKAQNDLLNLVRKFPNINVLGPNCLGFINRKLKLNASFARKITREEFDKEGSIAFISQSGAICTELLDKSYSTGNNFEYLISIGNKISVDEADIINYLKAESKVNLIANYLEFACDFEKLKISITNNKSIAVLFGGRNPETSHAVQSHTGVFAKPTDFVKLSYKKLGVITLNSLHELDNILSFYSKGKKINSSEFVIITNAGGPAVILNDLLAERGITLKELNSEILNEINENIPQVSGKNPIDLLGDATSERYIKILDVIERQKEILNLIIYISPQSVTDIDNIAKVIAETCTKSKHNYIVLIAGEDSFENARNIFISNKTPFFTDDEHLVNTLKTYLENSQLIETSSKNKITQEIPRKVLDYELTSEIIENYDITVPYSVKFKLSDDLKKIFELFSEREIHKSVLKIDNSFNAHKTDIGGVIANIKNNVELENSLRQIHSKIPEATNFILQEQISYSLEFFVGAKKDNDGNSIMILGLGGIYTNVLNDIVKFLLPASKVEIENCIKKLKIYEIFVGARGKPPLASDKLLDEIMKIQEMILQTEYVKEIDINPVLISEKYAIIADIKLYT